jgi:hypothetical protein
MFDLGHEAFPDLGRTRRTRAIVQQFYPKGDDVAQLALTPPSEALLSDSARARLDRLAAWPLAAASRRAQLRLGWSESRRRSVELAYRRFLALIAVDPSGHYGMAQGDVDELWHEHILDTVDYQAMCRTVFGRMIHHCPIAKGRGPADPPLYATTTLPALRRMFGVRAGAIWPAAAATEGFSKCCNHIAPEDELLAA